jgi:hypothetical protein
MISLETLDQLPNEPFKVIHNGIESFGNSVDVFEGGFVFWDGQRAIEVGTTYSQVDSDAGTVVVESPEYESVIEFHELKLEDRDLLLEPEGINTLTQLIEIATLSLSESKSQGVLPPETEPEAVTAAAPPEDFEPHTTLAFTITDDEEVLELIQSDASGVAVRENGDWTQLDLDEPQPTVDDLEWLEVNEAAIPFWDDVASADSDVVREDVLEYALVQE